MTMGINPPAKRKPRSALRVFLRWFWVLCLSLLLHWMMIEWGADSLQFQSRSKHDALPIQTVLLAPPQPKAIEPAKVKPRPKKHVHKPNPARASSARKPADETSTTQVSNRTAARTINAADIAAARASVADLEPSGVSPDSTVSLADGDDKNSYIVDLPPSAELEYDVQKTAKDDEPVYGHGTIKWQKDGHRYRIDGDAGVLFFTVLTFKSVGRIDDDGIVPNLYQEKRFRKTETSTLFQADHNTIHFSYNGNSLPRIGIELDRISVIWQLAGIGRGGSNRFSVGSEIDLLVAGTRRVSMWRMQIMGQEDIVIDGETISAWHITRIPKMGAHEQKLDLWLAPQKNWYPVRLRYTEDNGDFLDMTLSKLTPLKVSGTDLHY